MQTQRSETRRINFNLFQCVPPKQLLRNDDPWERVDIHNTQSCSTKDNQYLVSVVYLAHRRASTGWVTHLRMHWPESSHRTQTPATGILTLIKLDIVNHCTTNQCKKKQYKLLRKLYFWIWKNLDTQHTQTLDLLVLVAYSFLQRWLQLPNYLNYMHQLKQTLYSSSFLWPDTVRDWMY